MEEEIKAKSVLSPDEIDFAMDFVRESEDRNLLGKQRELFVEKRLQEILDAWQARRWGSVLQEILEIQEGTILNLLTMPDFYGKARVESLGRLSVIMLLKQATAHLSVEQVKLVNAVLRRINPDGKGLSDDPWKGMFLEMAKKFFPDDVEKMAEAVAEAGIDKDEYMQVIWEYAIEIIREDKDLIRKLVSNSDFVKIVICIDKYINHGLEVHARELLQAGDALLARGSSKTACRVYKALIEEQILIGEAREKIIEIRDKYDNDKLSYKRMTKKIKQYIAKAGLDIKI